jgi:hypothetical protein
MSEDGATILDDGAKVWIKDGKIHRENGPAAIYDGTKYWYLNDKLHRVDGPAIEREDGTIEWWLNDREYTFEEFLGELPKEDAIMVKLTWG